MKRAQDVVIRMTDSTRRSWPSPVSVTGRVWIPVRQQRIGHRDRGGSRPRVAQPGRVALRGRLARPRLRQLSGRDRSHDRRDDAGSTKSRRRAHPARAWAVVVPFRLVTGRSNCPNWPRKSMIRSTTPAAPCGSRGRWSCFRQDSRSLGGARHDRALARPNMVASWRYSCAT